MFSNDYMSGLNAKFQLADISLGAIFLIMIDLCKGTVSRIKLK